MINDAQSLDIASARTILFVGREVSRSRSHWSARAHRRRPGCPRRPSRVACGGSRTDDARALLLSNLKLPFDTAVCDRIVARATATRSPARAAARLERRRPRWRVGLATRQHVAGKSNRLCPAPRDSRRRRSCLSSRPPQSRSRSPPAASCGEILEFELADSVAAVDLGCRYQPDRQLRSPTRPLGGIRIGGGRTVIACTTHSPTPRTPSGTPTGTRSAARGGRSGR